MTIPALAVWLALLAVLERGWRRARRTRDAGTPMSQATFEEFVSFLHGTKRVELAQRSTQSLMRQEQNNGAPPHHVDLNEGIAILDPHRLKNRR